jgi:hypothetical protein
MGTININDIINEEVNNFDFLDTEKSMNEQETYDILSNEDFQKQFICDSILNKNDKIKIIGHQDQYITGNYDDGNLEEVSRMSVEYTLIIEYYYDSTKNPVKFELTLSGDDISIGADGWSRSATHDNPPESDMWLTYVDWNGINVYIYTVSGDDIKFTALEKAPYKIDEIFVRHYLEDFITKETNLNIKDKIDTSIISQYCH